MPNKIIKYEAKMPAHISKTQQRGNELVDVSTDIAIPRIAICQALSPQKNKRNDSYIEGIKEGDLFNTVTGEVYGNSINVVSIMFRKDYIVWVNRDVQASGGFRGVFKTAKEAKEFIAEQDADNVDDLEVVDTAVNFCLLVGADGSLSQVVTAMSKSAVKVSKKWNSLVSLSGGDRFAKAYKLGVIEDSNVKGEFYYNYSIESLGYVNKETYVEAENVYKSISQASITTNHDDNQQD